jgi:AraC-like DNA-binding protein
MMNFRVIVPIAPLKGYIGKIWVLESDVPIPDDDMKLVVPDGRLLMVIPFRNGIIGHMGNKDYLAPQHSMAIVGASDLPSIVNAQTDGPIGTIGVEVSPMGAYRFLHLRMHDIKKQLNFLPDILGKTARVIEQQIASSTSIDDKVWVLQQFLLTLFADSEKDLLFEYCIQQIEASKGGIKIATLERQTGYSSRWLNMKFEERLGMSPKSFSSVIRFQQYYRALLANSTDFFKQKQFFDHYHDESHFIKDFKRFTGLPPSKLIRAKNEFGNTFVRD